VPQWLPRSVNDFRHRSQHLMTRCAHTVLDATTPCNPHAVTTTGRALVLPGGPHLSPRTTSWAVRLQAAIPTRRRGELMAGVHLRLIRHRRDAVSPPQLRRTTAIPAGLLPKLSLPMANVDSSLPAESRPTARPIRPSDPPHSAARMLRRYVDGSPEIGRPTRHF
jgi:hypothetical protein